MLKKSLMISVRIPLSLVNKLEAKIDDGTFTNFSDALRKYAELGLFADSIKSKIRDPEFLDQIKNMKDKERIFEWTETLSDLELDGLTDALKIEKEKRYVS